MAFDAIAKRVAAAGEPFVSFFKTDELVSELRLVNFRHIEDLDTEQINARYFQDRKDGLQIGGGMAHLMCHAAKRGESEFRLREKTGHRRRRVPVPHSLRSWDYINQLTRRTRRFAAESSAYCRSSTPKSSSSDSKNAFPILDL